MPMTAPAPPVSPADWPFNYSCNPYYEWFASLQLERLGNGNAYERPLIFTGLLFKDIERNTKDVGGVTKDVSQRM